MKYIKLFNEHNNYVDFKNSDLCELPFVSFCKTENEVHYDKSAKIILSFNIEVDDATEPTKIISNTDVVSFIQIDNILQSEINETYLLSEGDHIINIGLETLELENSLFSQVPIDGELNIPNGIISIGEDCFDRCGKIDAVNIPESVTYIGLAAFENCENLDTVNLECNITELAANLFISCTALAYITIPNTVANIGYSCFHNCNSLETITIPKSVEYIDDEAFANCTDLRTAYFLKGETIDEMDSLPILSLDVFSGCTNLAIHVPNASAKERYLNTAGWNVYEDKIVADGGLLAEDAG